MMTSDPHISAFCNPPAVFVSAEMEAPGKIKNSFELSFIIPMFATTSFL